jgi:hypothetical protein
MSAIVSESDGVESGRYREDIERVAPVTLEVSGDALKAMNEAVYIAQQRIDAMHPDSREVHTFDRGEIRQVRKRLKQKIAEAKSEASSGDRRLWTQITLSEAEFTAIDEGVVEAVVNDKCSCSSRMHRLDNRLVDALQ